HGPTLAFKDFGARFRARCLAHARGDAAATVLTATSGDTGAAVAHAFHRVPGVRAIVLYPKGRISPLQERLFCTLGDNITTLAVDGTFDDCQTLVKAAFEAPGLRDSCGLTSANSINLARLVAQVVYYADALAQLPREQRSDTTFAVPCGNFGNLTAGLLGRAIGLELPRFVAATNANDTVPRFLSGDAWSPAPTVPTLSNAMDVSVPSNWPRAQRLMSVGPPLQSLAVSDTTTKAAMRRLHKLDYLSEPHSAIAHHALWEAERGNGAGVFLCTAHPAKFRETVEATLDVQLTLPTALAEREHLALLSHDLPNELDALLPYLRAEAV
ncbi:MAG: threonine synthase, partial [Flavobacteriales bacterium]